MRNLSVHAFIIPLALMLAACGGPSFTSAGRDLPTPDEPGIYALTAANDTVRIDGDPKWERTTWSSRSDLAPGTEFLVYDPALASSIALGDQPVRLWRVAWLRSELEPTGQAAPASGSEWVVPALASFSVPLVETPHPTIPGLVHVRPANGRLAPGLYELETTKGHRWRARVGILWTSTDKRAYSAENCVDRVMTGQAHLQPCSRNIMAADSYAPSDQPSSLAAAQTEAPLPAQLPAPVSGQTATRVAASPASVLKISLDAPVKDNGGLTIRGTIVNTSGAVQPVPPLRGTMVDGTGRVIDSWTFASPERAVPPGGQADFATWRPARDGAAKLNVDFAK